MVELLLEKSGKLKKGKRAPTLHIVELLNPETTSKFREWE